MKKQGRKIGDLINKKSLKLDKKTRKKTNHSFIRVEIIYKR